MSQWADALFGVASSEDGDYASDSNSDAEDESEAYVSSVEAFSAPVVNLASPSPSLQVPAAADDDDDIQILTAAEVEAEVAAAAQRAALDPNASRKRKRPRVETRPEPTECTICCEDCTIVGCHRLVALKCGHLFGKRCIERWINERRTCPNCSAGVRRADICLLYSDHVAVVDNAGLEAMTKKYEDEKVKCTKLERELASVQQQLSNLANDSARLRGEMVKFKKFYAELRYKCEQNERAGTGTSLSTLVASALGAAGKTPAGKVAASVTQTQPNFQAGKVAAQVTQSRPNSGAGKVAVAGTQFLQNYPAGNPSVNVFQPRAHGTAIVSNSQPVMARSTNPVAVVQAVAHSQPTSQARNSTNLAPSAPFAATIASSQPLTHPNNDALAIAVRKYKPVFDAPLLSARVFSIAPSCEFVCIGEYLSQDSHGIMLRMTQDSTRGLRIPAHSSSIRDIAIHRSGCLVLTVAFDGKLAVSNLREKKVVQQVQFPSGRRQGWSCGFSETDPYAMYCGFQDGSVAKYDMRKPASGEQGIVKNFSLPERQPVHSIKLFQTQDGYFTEGLAAATFRGLSVWKDVSDVSNDASQLVGNGSVGATPFSHVPSEQACFSLASNQLISRQVVVSSRSTPTKHSVFDLQTIGGGQLELTTEFAGHKAPSVLSRSAMWSEADGTSVVASWSHDTERVTLWNVATHREARAPEPTALSVASTSMPVVDIQHKVANGNWSSGTALLGTMTSRQLCVYRASA